MTELIHSLQGTDAGRQAALWLALVAALMHALFGAMQKGRYNPWVTRGGIDLAYATIALPLALFTVPWPEAHMWPILIGSFLLHSAYKLLQAAALSRGAYTVVYPVIRGSGPLFTVIGAGLLFGESFNPGQWGGLAVLVGGIFGLAALNWRAGSIDRATMLPALGLAVATGAFVATYTTWDAWAIRQTWNPFTFLWWFFVLDGLLMPFITRRQLMALPREEIARFTIKVVAGALVAYASFGAILIATRIGNVGEAAVLRETSVVFAALIGWLVLGERTRAPQLVMMVMIAAGAVIVKMAA